MTLTRSKRLIIALWLTLTFLAAAQLIFNTHYQSDMSAFMPRQALGPLAQSLQEGPAARLWMLRLRGEEADQLAKASEYFAGRLRDSGAFIQVLNGERVLDEATESLLRQYRYLLDDRLNADYFSSASLAQFLNQRLDELRSPLSSFSKNWLASDPTAAFLHLLERQNRRQHQLILHQGVWLTADRQQALILAETRVPAYDMAAQAQLRADFLQQLADWPQQGDVQLQLGGVPEIALQTRDAIQSDSQRLPMIASVFMLLFLGWVYRSPRRLFLSVLPLLGGALLGAAVVSLGFGGLHLITLAFGITVVGVAVDYPIHLFSHTQAGASSQAAMQRIWPTLRLGVISSVLGYSAMALTDFTGLAQLGVFSIVGLLTAALITRTLLPQLEAPAASVKPPALSALSQRLIQASPRHLQFIALLLLAATIIGLWLQETIWSDDISRLSPMPEHLRVSDVQLRQLSGSAGNRYLIAVEGENLESVLQAQENLQPVLDAAVQQQWLGSYTMASEWLPSMQRQRARQNALIDEDLLRQRLQAAVAQTPFQAQIFEPFIRDVAQAATLEPLLLEDFSASPIGLQLGRLLAFHGQRVGGTVSLSQVKNPAALQSHLQQVALPGVRFVDVKASSDQVVRQFRETALERVLLACVLIVAALWWGLRSLHQLPRVILPVAGAVLVAMAVPLLGGEPLNLFNLVSLLLVAGIGLDYSLFFSRAEAGGQALQTQHALLVCCISTVTVFAILSTSAIPVLHAIGLTVCSGVLTAFVLAWIFSREPASIKNIIGKTKP